MHYESFDYFAWWKVCVTDLKISPEQAWSLDYCELATLLELEQKTFQDASLMVNEQRIMNGMSAGELKNVH